MHLHRLASVSLLASAAASQCIPSSPNITTPFALEVLNSTAPSIHGRRMNLWKAGGGDNHLYLSPAGNASSNHTLVNGVIANWEPLVSKTIHAVINGEYTARDNTTKIFMTQRGDRRAVFDVFAGCGEEGAERTELRLRGGNVCVRPASGGRTEFRYSPSGNPLDVTGACTHVVLKVVFE